MGWYAGDVTGAGWILMSLLMLVFATALVYVGFVLGRRTGDDDTSGPVGHGGPIERTNAQRLLEQRLARGEIDADEYVRRIGVLLRSRS